jgi:hypothetical protein
VSVSQANSLAGGARSWLDNKIRRAGDEVMRATAESIRKAFILRHGEAAFETIAKRFAEVAGDSSVLDLSSVPSWRDFAISLRTVPRSDVLARAFLWCTRHKVSLHRIGRPTIPLSLEKIDDPAILRQLFELFPYFIANSQDGFRCEHCFDTASQLTDKLSQRPSQAALHQMISKAELSTYPADSAGSEHEVM